MHLDQIRLDFFFVLFQTRIFQLADKIVLTKSPNHSLKNQSEFVDYNFTRNKSFTNEFTYHLSSPEFPPLEVYNDPTFLYPIELLWLQICVDTSFLHVKKQPKKLTQKSIRTCTLQFDEKKKVSQMKSHTIFRPLNFLRQRLMMIQRFLSLSLYDDYYCHCQHCLLPRLHYLALPLRWFCKGKFGDLVNMGYYLQLTIRKPS